MNSLLSTIKEYGVVGAGGAGFPAHVKLKGQVDLVIVNAAECEPLLHKDIEILKEHTDRFLAGLDIVMEVTRAPKAIIGIKEKHSLVIEHLKECLNANQDVFALNDYYPVGDEITLIYEITGKVVKAGAIPISEGILVCNVETIANIGFERPVTTKFLNVAGSVENLNTFEVPLGIPFQDIIDYATPTIERYAVLAGGAMMGSIIDDGEGVVTKTTAALIVLPVDHVLVARYRIMNTPSKVHAIGKAACDQCNICTEQCPRYLLGHPIQPHLAMRSLLFSNSYTSSEATETHARFCCECNLCSLIACPEGLYPAQTCISQKKMVVTQKKMYQGLIANTPHPLAEYRRIASAKLKKILDLNRFKDEGPLTEFAYQPEQVVLELHQHIGVPAKPLVNVKQKVQKGQKIATVGEQLGSEIHSPIDGYIKEITDREISIENQ